MIVNDHGTGLKTLPKNIKILAVQLLYSDIKYYDRDISLSKRTHNLNEKYINTLFYLWFYEF